MLQFLRRKRMKKLLLAVICAGIFVPAAAGRKMVAADIYDEDKQWCYSPESTTVIGMPFVPEPVQVTYDGAIYTRYAELAFFTGEDFKPLFIPQKEFAEDMPAVIAEFEENGILYRFTAFSGETAGLGRGNLVQAVAFEAQNISQQKQQAVLGAGVRGSGVYRRLGKCKFDYNVDTTFEFEIDEASPVGCFLRDGELVYSFRLNGDSCAVKMYSVVGSIYNGGYKAGDFNIDSGKITGISRISAQLNPGDKINTVFFMPRIPVAEDELQKEIINLDYLNFKQKTLSFWQQMFTDNTFFSIPEARVNSSWKNALFHLILATREQEDGKRQGSGLPYDALFLNDFADMRLAYDVYGLNDFVEVNIPWLKKQQLDDGMFIDMSLSHGEPILASHGQALFSLAGHLLFSTNSEKTQDIYPQIKSGAEWIVSEHRNNKNGLMRPSIPYDNEMIKGCYTSHNLWSLLGLRSAIRAAELTGHEDDALLWRSAHASYLETVKSALSHSYKKKGYISTGLYNYITGPLARAGFAYYRTDQDWENNLLIYPTEVLSDDSDVVFNTVETIRKRKYHEGVMTYRNGQHLHQYITINQANQYLAMGEGQQALKDLYHVLLHNGSTGEGFENLVEPWTDRNTEPSCPQPHGWAAAKTALFIRNMLVREYGGDAGLEEGMRGLYLFSLISPAWLPDNESNETYKTVEIKDAATEFGRISAEMRIFADKLEVTVKPDFHTEPGFIRVPVPWFAEITGPVSEEAGFSVVKYGRAAVTVELKPDTTKVIIPFTVKQNLLTDAFADILSDYRSETGFVRYNTTYNLKKYSKVLPDEAEYLYSNQPLSFELVKKAFVHEFNRRVRIYKEKGGHTRQIETPAFK
jgi:hypothetical protein